MGKINEIFSEAASKEAFVATTILSSGKEVVMKAFFLKDPSKEIPEPEERTYKTPPFIPDIISSTKEVTTQSENEEEIKYYDFKTEREDTKALDNLFEIVKECPTSVNETAYGNLEQIAYSFYECNYVQSDFLRYIFSREDIVAAIQEQISHESGMRTLKSVLNLRKYLVDETNSSMYQLLLHKERLFKSLYQKYLLSNSAEEVEFINVIFLESLSDARHLCDGTYFIEKTFFNLKDLQYLFNKINNHEVSPIDLSG